VLGALVLSAFTKAAARVSAPPEVSVRPADLMEKYCGGSDAAFRELYALAAPRLLAYLVCLARERTTAEEILQLTFIKLHQSRASYVRGADPMPWLYTIAHRTFLDEARRRKRSRVAPARDELPDIAATFEESDDPYTEQQIAQVLAALEHLPENQRDALVLTKIQGKSIAEAAGILGTTPGAVKLRAHRGYVTLRELLRSSPEGER
jgi:RNA polymerase sigma-70 factor (ECF subfamily)